MKKLVSIALALALICAGLLTAFAEEQDLLDKVLAAGKLVVGSEGTYPPNSYYDENNNLTGFDVEVGRAIAQKLGVEYEPYVADWASLMTALEFGTIDTLIEELEPTEERAQKYDFSVPYTYIHGAALVAGDNEEITSADDLAGKKAAQNETSLWGERARNYGMEVVPVTDDYQTYQLITTGRADVTLNAETAFNDYMAQHPEANVKIAFYTEDASSSVVPVRKGNEKFLAAVNEAIDALREEGVLSELSVRFFGFDYTQE